MLNWQEEAEGVIKENLHISDLNLWSGGRVICRNEKVGVGNL